MEEIVHWDTVLPNLFSTSASPSAPVWWPIAVAWRRSGSELLQDLITTVRSTTRSMAAVWNGPSVGLTFGLDLDERFRLEVSGGVSQRSVEYEMEEGGKVLLPNAPDPEIAGSIPRSYLTFDADILLLTGSVGASYQPMSIGDFDVRLHGGVGITSVLDATYEGRVERNPEFREDSLIIQVDPPPSPESTSRQTIPDASSVIFSLHGALSLDIPITTTLTLVPTLSYGHQLTPLVRDTDWRARVFGGNVDLVWRL